MSKPLAVFASVVLALAGANVMELWARVTTYWFSNQLPSTTVFATVFWAWAIIAGAVAWCGLMGGYLTLRHNAIATSYLPIFVIASCFVIKIGGQEFGFSSVRLAFNLGFSGFYLGLNVLGIALWWWFRKLHDAGRPQRMSELEAARGRGAV